MFQATPFLFRRIKKRGNELSIGICAMSITIIDRKSASEELRTSLRKFRPGPELDLVESFLERVEIKVPRSCGITIFREPKIQSGFPDLVVVVWDKAKAKRWNPLRVKLLTKDIRLMHFICHTGPCTTKDLHSVSLSKLGGLPVLS